MFLFYFSFFSPEFKNFFRFKPQATISVFRSEDANLLRIHWAAFYHQEFVQFMKKN